MLNLQLWNVVNEKANWQKEDDTFNRQMLRRNECTPPFSYSKALCLSSLLLLDFCTMALGIPSHTIGYIFSHSNYLLNSMTKDTMDSHIHSVLACSLKWKEHCTKKKKKGQPDLFLQIHSWVLWLRKTFGPLTDFFMHKNDL